MNRAGFGIRLGAVIIDWVIIGIVYAILNGIIGKKVVFTPDMTFDQMFAIAQSSQNRTFIALAIAGLAMAGLEILKRQTPGKMALKLIVSSADGSVPSQQQMLLRSSLKYGVYVFYLLSGLTGIWAVSLLGGLVGLTYFGGAFVSLGATKQALHDLLGKTCVLSTGPVTVPQGFPVNTVPPPPPVA